MDTMLLKSAGNLASAIREKKISAAELLTRQFERVDSINPDLNAIIWQDRDNATDLARKLDEETAAGKFRGPLHGLPITVKESFDLVGSPATWGYPEWKNNFPKHDAEVVERYKAAGAIIFGKTNVPLKLAEWQSFNDIYGTTNNPWDLTRTPGGSSGGSAAALATGMTTMEAGSDIGSSIRNPAHYCGVFGLKPTWNVVPTQGQAPPGWFGDIDIAVTGPMARTAGDLELGFDILVGADRFLRTGWKTDCPADTKTRLSQFTIALKLGDKESPVEQAYLDSLAGFADRLEKAGATVIRDRLPEIDSAAHYDMYLKFLSAALSMGVSNAEIDGLRSELEALNSPMASSIMVPRLLGMAMSHRDWLETDNERRVARLKFDTFFTDVDILLCPVCASPAFHHDQDGKRFTRTLTVNGKQQPEMLQNFWSGYSGVVGLPSSVGPMDLIDGLPVGYQAIAGYGRDRTALAFTRAVEAEIGGFVPPPAYR